MKLLSAVTIAILAISSLFANQAHFPATKFAVAEQTENATENQQISDFDKAVALIKKYEGLHQPKHYPLVGYGHRVLPGEKFSRSKTLSESEADKLLRKDLLKNCAVFRAWGPDSLILGVLAYNIGSGNVLRSSVAKKLKAGDREIYSNYISHARYRGKIHSQIQRRRIEEFETLFIKDLSAHKSVEKEILINEAVEENNPLAMTSSEVFGPFGFIFDKAGELVTDLVSVPSVLMARFNNSSLPNDPIGPFNNQQIKSWMACI